MSGADTAVMARPGNAATGRAAMLVHRAGEIDTSVCRQLNRASRIHFVRTFFSVVSRLGDGVFWYILIALIAVLDPGPGYAHALQMTITGAVGVLLYKLLKSRTVRPRPYAGGNDIELCSRPLDQYSFPSGHTLHAFSFSLIACAHYPFLYAPLMLFAALVALSRMILGLHYPSDVLAGAAIGGLLAAISFNIYP